VPRRVGGAVADSVAQVRKTTCLKAEPPGAAALEGVARRVGPLEARVEALEERFHETLANLAITVVDGYVVKTWPDLETDQWVAECAAVGACVQGSTREEALTAIHAMVPEMLAALQDWGEPLPPREV
jgi:predicted RNase H-like HicB family nuclease